MAGRCIVAATLAAAVTAAGCGSAAEAGDEDLAHEAVETVLDLCAHGRYAVGNVLAAPARRVFVEDAGTTREGCGAALGLEGDDDAELRRVFEEAHITEVTTTGGLAEVVVESLGGRRTTLEVEDSGSRWEVTRPSF